MREYDGIAWGVGERCTVEWPDWARRCWSFSDRSILFVYPFNPFSRKSFLRSLFSHLTRNFASHAREYAFNDAERIETHAEWGRVVELRRVSGLHQEYVRMAA